MTLTLVGFYPIDFVTRKGLCCCCRRTKHVGAGGIRTRKTSPVGVTTVATIITSFDHPKSQPAGQVYNAESYLQRTHTLYYMYTLHVCTLPHMYTPTHAQPLDRKLSKLLKLSKFVNLRSQLTTLATLTSRTEPQISDGFFDEIAL